jgi:hypothetical protein
MEHAWQPGGNDPAARDEGPAQTFALQVDGITLRGRFL